MFLDGHHPKPSVLAFCSVNTFIINVPRSAPQAAGALLRLARIASGLSGLISRVERYRAVDALHCDAPIVVKGQFRRLGGLPGRTGMGHS